MEFGTFALIVAAWFAVGAAVGVLDARHGAWRRGWVASAVLGPCALPLALARRRNGRPSPVVLTDTTAEPGPADLLVGIDGSESSMGAALRAARVVGGRANRITLAAVLDIDTAAPHASQGFHPAPWPEEDAARDHLAAAAARLVAHGIPAPGSVILSGEPAEALERYAREQHYELIVIGQRGQGLSKFVLGSCAAHLAKSARVPVLIVPADPATSAASSVVHASEPRT